MPCKTRNMDAAERAAVSHELELKHQNHIHKTQLIAKDEDTRRQRVTKQVLSDENLILRETVAEKDVQINQLIYNLDKMRAELDSVMETNRDQQNQLKSQTREFANIKAELESLNSMSQESTKVLAEKLTLMRELNTLKPELEHLRSQVAHQQTAIAEKLALERQLNMAEVELAAEKRAREQQVAQAEGSKTTEAELQRKLKAAEKKLATEQREKEELQQELEAAASTVQSGDDNKKVEAELTRKLKEMEEVLSAEEKEKEKIRKDSEIALSEAQAQNEMLEQRLDTLKSKLRNSQEELKAVRSELVHTRSAAVTAPAARVGGGAKATNARKRRAEELSISDMSIGTPEEITRGKRLLKKKGLEQTMVGEKSMFSITPFLNKSKTLAVGEEEEEDDMADVSYIPAHAQAQEEVAEAEVEDEVEEGIEEPEEPPVIKETTTKVKTKAGGEIKKARGRPKKALGETSTNPPPQAPAPSEPVVKSTSPVEDAADALEADKKEDPAPAKAAKAVKKTASAATTNPGVRDQEVKKKKRKLAGESTTLFDDDDDEGDAAATAKRPGKLSKPLGKTHLSMVRNAGAFGKRTFSPLKKDRRGVGASFLA